jgi:hypothetical protein
VADDVLVTNSPLVGFDACVFKASGLDDFVASGGVGGTAIMAVPQASQLVAPALRFFPQFIQNIMDVVLDPEHKIYSLRPGSMGNLAIYLCKTARSLNQNDVDGNRNGETEGRRDRRDGETERRSDGEIERWNI